MNTKSQAKVVGGKYLAGAVLVKGEFCTVKEATSLDGSQKFALKIYKKMALRKRKEYHKRKDGHGMEVVD